jgi:hypothetical protein
MLSTFWGRNEEENEEQEQWIEYCIGFNLNLSIMKDKRMPNIFIFIVQSYGYISRVRNRKATFGGSWYNS